MQQSFPSIYDTPEVRDELNIKDNPELTSLLEQGEIIIFSGLLTKINKHEVAQNRLFLITNKNLYNIQPSDSLLTKVTFFLAPQTQIKRKIPLDKIYGITISCSGVSNEFIIHVSDDYDYRYEGESKRETILRILCSAYSQLNQKPLPLYIRGEQDLSVFHTSDDDFKAGVNKKPQEGKVLVTRELLATKGLDWIIMNRKDLRNQDAVKKEVYDFRVPTETTSQVVNNGNNNYQGQYNGNYQNQQTGYHGSQVYNGNFNNQGGVQVGNNPSSGLEPNQISDIFQNEIRPGESDINFNVKVSTNFERLLNEN